MKIVFFGTPEFATHCLREIIDHGFEVSAVVTAPDRKGGRGNKIIESDVKKFAVEKGLDILQPEKLRDPDFINALNALEADLFIVIAFRMLPQTVWSIPRLGTFNLHASLLPQFRGAAPINHAIITGQKVTGVTTFLINEEIDKGKILLSDSVEIAGEETFGTLHDKLMEIGGKLVIKTIEGLEAGTLQPVSQEENDTLLPAPKIFKPTCRIDFSATASEIDFLVRGLNPVPAAWSNLRLEGGKEMEVKILKVKNTEIPSTLSPGDCKVERKMLLAAAKDCFVEIVELQPAGKKPMDARAFLAGYKPEKFF